MCKLLLHCYLDSWGLGMGLFLHFLLVFTIKTYALVGGESLSAKEASQWGAVTDTFIFSANGEDVIAAATAFIKVGPRIVLTCAHCVDWQPNVSINGESVKVHYLKDLSTLTTIQRQVRMIERPSDMPRRYDFAAIIIPEHIPLPKSFVNLPAISIAQDAYLKQVLFVGNGSTKLLDERGFETCKGPKQWQTSQFHITEEHDIYFAVTGRNLGIYPEVHTYTCRGDSGGYFINAYGELYGLNTSGTSDKEHLASGNILQTIPAYLSFGINLTSPQMQTWFQQLATSENIEICGINRRCNR